MKRALLNVLSLVRVVTSVLEGEDALSDDPSVRSRSDFDQLRRENALLKEELRLKDARMERVSPRRRPHYRPAERMSILELKACRGWTAEEVANRFHLSSATVSSWQRRVDDPESAGLLELREPANKFPQFIRLAVKRLKLLCPRLGKDKIAEMFCPAGMEISASTVSRIVKEPSPAPESGPAKKTLVRPRRPNEAWLIDLTVVPIGGFGFWINWSPFSVPQCWPFCDWVGAVIDMYSRRIQGVTVFHKEPTASAIRELLTRVANRGGLPKYLVSDHDPVFKCKTIRDWCGESVGHRFGAVGQKGSIAIIERFFLTLKNQCTRVITVGPRQVPFRREIQIFRDCYNEHRTHASLGGRTPQEVYDGVATEATPPLKGEVIQLKFYKQRRHLPIVRRAA